MAHSAGVCEMKTETSLITALLVSLNLLVSGCGGSSGTAEINQPPQITATGVNFARSGKTYTYAPVSTDPNNDELTFTIQNKPAWANFDEQTGVLSGQPDDGDIQQYNNIIITVSDGEFETELPPFTLSVMYAEVGRNNVQTAQTAVVTDTASGYDVVGDATIAVGNLVTELKNADLQFEYDENGDLLNLSGDTDLPPVISDNLALDTSVRAIVGMYTGAEINASVDIGPDSEPGILLRDEFRYLVYFLDTSVDLTFKGADGVEEPISLGLAGTRTLIITDPTDPFFYYFGQVAGVALGFGTSENSNIPYRPLFDPDGPTAFEPLQPFYGEAILKGSFPISAFKVFDVLELSGVAVCAPPQLLSCGKPSPSALVASTAKALLIDGGIDPSQQLKLGINGSASIKFAILGIDLFEYKLLDMAAMIDIGTTNEHLAIQGVIDPGESVSPSWLPITPVPDPNAIMVANLFADVDPQTGDGDFGISLYGAIDSTFPQARMNGVIDINPRGLQMMATIDDPTNPITVKATVDDQALDANIEFGYDFQANIDTVVNDALDRASQKVEQLFNELDTAIGDYDVALSLDGVRTQIPALVDTAKGILDGVPGSVYTSVYNGTKDGINSGSYTYTSPIGTKTKFYAKDYVSATGVAKTEATTARTNAQNIIDIRKAQLDELKAQALETQDGPAFRTALKTALQTVINNDKYSQKVTVKRTIKFKIAGTTVATRTFTFYNKTLSYTILDTPTKSTLQTAADNVDDIEPNFTVMVNTQQLYDAAPKQQAIDQTRSDISDGSLQVPTINGGGYTLTRAFEQSAYILLDNQRIDISFNPLDPAAAIEGVGDVIVAALIP